MTQKVLISAETEAAIRAAAILPYKATGKQRPDGRWEVELSDETYERLQAKRLVSETMDQTIFRVVTIGGKKLS